MLLLGHVLGGLIVALLAEGVDRNYVFYGRRVHDSTSPSSQRAWIEINYGIGTDGRIGVALLAEGVDRNFTTPI